jgi:elongation factor 1-gamma
LDADSEETKKMVADYLSWTGTDKGGRPFSQGKIFK